MTMMSEASRPVAARIERAAQALPQVGAAHWLVRLPLAAVLFTNGLDKFPLSADVAAGWGLPLAVWAVAAVGELAVAILLVVGGLLRGGLGDLVTRAAGLGAALIVAGVIWVAYWAPPLDLLRFNAFQVILLCSGLYLALAGRRGT